LRILKKIALYTLATALVVVISLVASVFIFKDRIIQRFISEANKSLGTPVKIGKIEVSAFDEFPDMAIVLTDVYVEDSHDGEYPLLTAKKVSFVLNTLEVWRGIYTIHGLQIRDSEANLKIDKDGKNNYTIVKSSGKGGSAVSFDLENVKLTNTFVSYIDVSAAHHHEFSSAQLTANINAKGDVYHIEALGDVVTEQIGIGTSIWFSKKLFDINAILDYDDAGKSVKIDPSQLVMDKAHFEVSGLYQFKEKNLVDLHTIGKDTDIRLLLSFFPANSVERFRKYQSRGDVYFDLKIKGEISQKKDPFLSASFGMRNVTVYHPDSKARIENANFDGSFATPSFSTTTKAELFLSNISATLNGDPFTGNFSMKNFDDPYVNVKFKGELNAADVLNFYPVKEVTSLSGRINADISLYGQIELLKKKATAQQVHTEGTIDLKDINITTEGKYHFIGLNGAMQFNNNDLAMSDLRGKFENTDFAMNGFFKNIVTFLIFENQPVGIEADLKSNFVDVDQLFDIGFGTDEKGPYKFSISNNLNLNFTYNIKSMRYKRFHPTGVKGDLLVKGQVAVARNMQLQAMGGTIDLSGIVDAKNPKAIDLISSAKLNGIQIDSLFYVFGNFQQDFIDHTHLKGQAFADISMEASLDETLRIFQETLIADVSATIKNGELNNFAPMQKLNKYLDDEGLNKLRFADLKNDIHIENKTVYIPSMEISSNLTAITLSGTHTFDQRIDYRVVAPLRNKKKIDPDEAFGAIEEDTKGKSKVFLKIVGTTSKYEVIYDKAAVKKKITADLKKEVQELKEAFRLKGQKKKKELELEKDEYFDWEEPKTIKN
jgi:hypothetical protein